MRRVFALVLATAMATAPAAAVTDDDLRAVEWKSALGLAIDERF